LKPPQSHGAFVSPYAEMSIVFFSRTKLSLFCLIGILTALSVYPNIAYGLDYRDQEALKDARVELLKKEDELLKEEEGLRHEIGNLNYELNRNNDQNLSSELRFKDDQLNQVESELRRTRDDLRDIEKTLR
jgi:septal ring factor EnvC (AmiA/AmiB activator)